MDLISIRKPFSAAAVYAALILCIMPGISGCSETWTSTRKTSAQPDPIVQERAAKDAAFKTDSNSPIRPQDRSTFQNLVYYPINPGLKFTVRLNRYAKPEQIRLGTNTGEIRSGLRYGHFDFQVEDQACRLQVYRLDDTANGRDAYLFIPFRDSTSGVETYGAGRYIDLKENTSGIYDLDFNRAYNPYCAYNSEFSCPIALEENTLKVPIRAGEKNYPSARKN